MLDLSNLSSQVSDLPPAQIAKILKKIPTAEFAFSYLPAYVGIANPNYEFAKHHSVIADYLMKVEQGKIRRLVVAMPPRHGKSHLISEIFVPWYLGRNPDHQVIYATYNRDLALVVGRKVKNYMTDPTFGRIFKGCHLSVDAKAAHQIGTQEGGTYYAVGINSGTTGRGANCLIVDDPLKDRKEADSETYKRDLVEWFRAVAYTRLQTDNRIIIVQTRWTFDDLVGYALDELSHEGWQELSLPAICEDHEDMLGRSPGEALWPNRYPVEVLEKTKETVGTREWNALYQQRPLPAEGGLVQLNWFGKYDFGKMAPVLMALRMEAEPPELPFGIRRIVISWDTAFKESQLSDPSAATVWGISKENNFYLLDIINRHMKYPKLKKTTINLWEFWMKCNCGQIPVIIEDKASGQSLIQDLARSTKIPVIKVRPDANKQVRMSSVSPLIEAGRVHLPDRARWLVEYETQIARFPLWKFDDLVDSTSQFLGWVGRPKYKINPKKRFWK
jgi:predicted phage terminase large subunit-like protein